MKILRIVAAVVVGLVLFAPEVRRYRGERGLAYGEAVAQFVRTRPEAAHDPRMKSAIAAAGRLSTSPGDWRPLLTSASLLLAAGNREAAIAHLEKALRLGERPEVNVTLAALLREDGDEKRAGDLLTRAIWISPAVAAHVRSPSREDAIRRVSEMERRLRQGSLREDEFPEPR